MNTVTEVYGECAKHRGENIVNCSMCAMESFKSDFQLADDCIKETQNRIDAGLVVMAAAKKQIAMLRKKLKEQLGVKHRLTFKL